MLVGDVIALFPTEEQQKQFFSFAGASRFVYNESLANKMAVYQSTGKTLYVQDMIEHIQDLKAQPGYAWLWDVPEAVTKQAIKDLDKAFKMFFKRGNKGFPHFKSKRTCKPSFYQRTDKLYMVDDTHIKITGIKEPVRTHKKLMTDSPKNPRVIFDGKFWYLSYSYEFQEPEIKTEGDTIGVDLGIKNLATCSDGVVYNNINKTSTVKKLESRKKKLQRKIARKYELNKVGNVYKKTNNIIKMEKQVKLIDRRLRNIRNTYLHTVTYELSTRAKLIGIEDLSVSCMMKNKHLSKAIQDQGWYKFREMLTYKCKAYGTKLVVADKKFPSSKTMSCCGYRFKMLSLSQRTLTCPICGKKIDRDLNAAINLRNYALAH